MHRKLNITNIKSKCPPPGPNELNGRGKPLVQHIYWDTELKGFGFAVGKCRKSFIVQKDINGRSIRYTIGHFPPWTPDKARKQAKEIIIQMDQGINPNIEKRREADKGITLADAIEMHIAAMRAKKCTEGSMQIVREATKKYLPGLVNRPLKEITPNECAQHHERITQQHGSYVGNRVLQNFRACYNTARRRHPQLPENPVRGVTFNKTRRRREPIKWEDLPDWYEKVLTIKNPVRRDLQLFILFTGLRSTDAKTVRWEHVDFEAGTIHRPKPKGGEDRAFTVPVSDFVLELLKRRRDENPNVLLCHDDGWVFPSINMQSRITHIREVKEQRYKGKKKRNYLPSPHRLRDTYASAAHEASVPLYDLKVLMNHALPANPDDVTHGYILQSLEHLKKCQESITAFLLAKMKITV